MSGIAPYAFIAALLCEAGMIAGLIWSIRRPDLRIWPPHRVTSFLLFIVWTPTIVAFVGAAIVGIAQWNDLGWPVGVRWGVGLELILAGNAVVWPAVLGIGVDATNGAVAELKTDGLYRWTRNPQYLADMGILIGWAILSASPAAWIVGMGGVLVFALTPFAEEPWLEKVYGASYRTYRKRTPRFFGRSRV